MAEEVWNLQNSALQNVSVCNMGTEGHLTMSAEAQVAWRVRHLGKSVFEERLHLAVFGGDGRLCYFEANHLITEHHVCAEIRAHEIDR